MKTEKLFTSSAQGVYEDGALLGDEPEEIRSAVLAWIREQLLPSSKVDEEHSSYGLKHILQEDTGIYLSNNAMKDAMMMAGYSPVDPSEANWHYRIAKSSKAFDWRSRRGKKRPEAHPAQVKRWEAVSNG